MKRLSLALLALLASAALAAAQTIGVTPLTGGSGGGGSVTLATTCPSSSQTGSSLTLNNGANTKAVSTSTTLDGTYACSTIEATADITLPATITSSYQVTIGNANPSGGSNITLHRNGNTLNGAASDIVLAPAQYVGVFAGSGVSPTNWDVAGAVSASAAVGTDPGYVVSQWYVGVNVPGDSATGAALTTGTAYCAPQKLMNPVSSGGTGTIGSLAIRVPTIGTSTITEAVYQDAVVGGVHRPKTLLGYTAQAANTSVTTLTGALNAGISVSSGLIWTCATQGDSTGKVSLMSGGTGAALAYTGNGSATALLSNTGDGVTFPVTYGATAALTWPADASGLTYSESTNLTPFILFQFSSIP